MRFTRASHLGMQEPRANGTSGAAAAEGHVAGAEPMEPPALAQAQQQQQQRARAASPTGPPVKRIGVLMVQLCSATMRHTTPLHPAVRIRVGKQVCIWGCGVVGSQTAGNQTIEQGPL